MKALYELIHARANATWEGCVDLSNYELWVRHWVETARLLAKEFNGEGLPKTAEALNDIANQQGKYSNEAMQRN